MSRLNPSVAEVAGTLPDAVLDWFDQQLQADHPVVLTDVKVHRRARCHYLWLPELTAPRLFQKLSTLIKEAQLRGHTHVILIDSMDALSPIRLDFAHDLPTEDDHHG